MKERCVICVENLISDHPGPVAAVPCGHVFHGGCIIQWLRRNASICPECKRPIHRVQQLNFNHSLREKLTASMEDSKMDVHIKDEICSNNTLKLNDHSDTGEEEICNRASPISNELSNPPDISFQAEIELRILQDSNTGYACDIGKLREFIAEYEYEVTKLKDAINRRDNIYQMEKSVYKCFLVKSDKTIADLNCKIVELQKSVNHLQRESIELQQSNKIKDRKIEGYLKAIGEQDLRIYDLLKMKEFLEKEIVCLRYSNALHQREIQNMRQVHIQYDQLSLNVLQMRSVHIDCKNRINKLQNVNNTCENMAAVLQANANYEKQVAELKQAFASYESAFTKLRQFTAIDEPTTLQVNRTNAKLESGSRH